MPEKIYHTKTFGLLLLYGTGKQVGEGS